MNGERRDVSVIYCTTCGARLGRLGVDSVAGYTCPRCKSEYMIERHSDRMSLEQISSKQRPLHET